MSDQTPPYSLFGLGLTLQEQLNWAEAKIETLKEEPCTLFVDPFDGGTITAHGSSWDFECGPHAYRGELGEEIDRIKEDIAYFNELEVLDGLARHEVFWVEFPEPKQEDEDEDLPW
tara:strand:- start:1333 stop:1680 length:348 start_codon:yes stop_codon:yes gene_type:complete